MSASQETVEVGGHVTFVRDLVTFVGLAVPFDVDPAAGAAELLPSPAQYTRGESWFSRSRLAAPFALPVPGSQQERRLGVLWVVKWLQNQPGDSWQDRWRASGAEDHDDWRDLLTAAGPAGTAAVAAGPASPQLPPGLLVLICADVIRPSLGWLLTSLRGRGTWPPRWAGPGPGSVRRADRVVSGPGG